MFADEHALIPRRRPGITTDLIRFVGGPFDLAFGGAEADGRTWGFDSG
jgi:hypothetical protein